MEAQRRQVEEAREIYEDALAQKYVDANHCHIGNIGYIRC
jgi:hypothetical protein